MRVPIMAAPAQYRATRRSHQTPLRVHALAAAASPHPSTYGLTPDYPKPRSLSDDRLPAAPWNRSNARHRPKARCAPGARQFPRRHLGRRRFRGRRFPSPLHLTQGHPSLRLLFTAAPRNASGRRQSEDYDSGTSAKVHELALSLIRQRAVLQRCARRPARPRGRGTAGAAAPRKRRVRRRRSAWDRVRLAG